MAMRDRQRRRQGGRPADAEAREARAEHTRRWADARPAQPEPTEFERERQRHVIEWHRYYASLRGDTMAWAIDHAIYRYAILPLRARDDLPAAERDQLIAEHLASCADHWAETMRIIHGISGDGDGEQPAGRGDGNRTPVSGEPVAWAA